MVLLHKVLWAFVFMSLNALTSGLEFGVCENIVTRKMTNDSVSPPVHYTVKEVKRECCQGFMMIGKTCQPMCQNVCINSVCIGNNKCRCREGYYAIDNFRCLPKCEPQCGSGMACLGPNQCVCKSGYKKINGTLCEPICSFTTDNFECINAKCVAHNECECFEGYRRVSDFQCEPICTKCEHGDCIAPETCECHNGYEKNSDEVCAPICEPQCINGECVAPNTCKCNKNFEKYLKSFECLEKHVIKDRQSCLKSCQHGSCSDEGTCVCDDGYEKYNDMCSKICDNECTNGKCLEDVCVCPENYKLSENGTSCLPICSFEDGHDCISGVCIAPQVCQCFPGYKFLDSRNCTCVPMCDPMCINGVCTESGCICHETFYNISSYECIRNCSEGFSWVYDDCIEETDLSQELIFDDVTIISTTAEYDEDTSENEEATTMTEESLELTSIETTTMREDDDEDEEEDGSTNHVDYTTEREDVMVEKSFQQLIPTTTCIIFLSIIIVLITLILITFCFLYRRINPKNIYYVNEQEKSSNCVYFTTQSEVARESTEEECNL